MKALEDDVREALAIMRRHINPLASSLYRVPPDVFPEIASHLTSETDLLNATHVSFHLRSILLSHPSLWSHVNFEHETRARAFFERSGQTPLHIDLAQDSTGSVASLAELRQQSRRIVTLKLYHWSGQKMFLSESLPSMRRLEIYYEHYHDEEQWDEGWDTDGAPVWEPTKQATSWSFPSLTSLIIYNLSPIPFHTPHITCFKFWNGESSIDEDKLLGFLDNCPLLEHIDIFYRFYVGGHRSKHDLAVLLPNLRSYTETIYWDVCPLLVFNMLSIPPFCSVTLRFRCGGTTAETNDILPHFKDPGYLAEIKRVKLRTTNDADGKEVAGTLELINAKGARVCSDRGDPENRWYQPFGQGGKKYPHNVAHLSFLRSLNGRSVETLCIDGYTFQDGVAVEFMKEALGSGNVKTLILSRSAVSPCLVALNNEGLSASGHSRRFLSTHTLIIGPDPYPPGLRDEVLQPLLRIVQKRKVAGFPFGFVLLFLNGDPGWGWDMALEELKMCVERLEVVIGDDVLDWDVDRYFLHGLDHLQDNRDIQWD